MKRLKIEEEAEKYLAERKKITKFDLYSLVLKELKSTPSVEYLDKLYKWVNE